MGITYIMDIDGKDWKFGSVQRGGMNFDCE